MRLGNTLALGGVSLVLNAAEIIGVNGKNGAGKSTLLNVIAGIYKPTSGEIWIRKQPKLKIGLVPQEIALYESMTGRQNLEFWADVGNLQKEARKKRINWLLSELKLMDKANTAVSNYSGGMKRRLNLGVSLLATPNLLLLDEPTVGADDDSIEIILHFIKHIKEISGTVMFISHHSDELMKVCTRMIKLENGVIVSDESIVGQQLI